MSRTAEAGAPSALSEQPPVIRPSSSLHQLHDDALAMFDAALKAADPYDIISRALSLRPHSSLPDSHTLVVTTHGGETFRYHLQPSSSSAEPVSPSFSSVLVIAVGKAAVPMAAAAESVLVSTPYLTGGLVVTKHHHYHPSPSVPNSTLRVLPVLESSHPVPAADSEKAGQEVLRVLHEHAGRRSLVLFLLSGGASSLMETGVDGVSLPDITAMTQQLMRCGAEITEMNAIRVAVSRVKGGGCAQAAGDSAVLGLLLSDVVGDDLRVIGSGPTVPQRRDRRRCRAVLDKYGLGKGGAHALPQSVLDVLDALPDREGEDEPRDAEKAEDDRLRNALIGSSLLSVQAAASEGRKRGYASLMLTDRLVGDVQGVHALYPAMAASAIAASIPIASPCCIVAGGETTVRMQQQQSASSGSAAAGSGGRNQHLALLSLLPLSRLPADSGVVFLSAGTDGTDGPTDAAGAVVTNRTLRQSQQLGLAADEYAARYDSYGFFDCWERERQKRKEDEEQEELLSCHIKTGPTGTNVADLHILIVGRCSSAPSSSPRRSRTGRPEPSCT